MAAWEYKTAVKPYHELLTEAQLNELGAHGFELINSFVVTETATVVGRQETQHKVHYFFKRQKA
ncbi:MAG: hypothetical protein ACLQVA_07520 [Candidatus Brocadiia bacterium]